ncbi:SUKH-4 family immunity protein [Kitasatospora arboriphila]
MRRHPARRTARRDLLLRPRLRPALRPARGRRACPGRRRREAVPRGRPSGAAAPQPGTLPAERRRGRTGAGRRPRPPPRRAVRPGRRAPLRRRRRRRHRPPGRRPLHPRLGGLPARVEGFFEVLPGLPDVAAHLAATGRGRRVPDTARAVLAEYVLLGTDGHALVAVQCGDGGTGTGEGVGRVWAVDPDTGTGRYLNADLSSYVRCLALLAAHRPARRGLDAHAAAEATDGFQQQLAALDPTVFQDPENWWAVVVEQMWDGLL